MFIYTLSSERTRPMENGSSEHPSKSVGSSRVSPGDALRSLTGNNIVVSYSRIICINIKINVRIIQYVTSITVCSINFLLYT